MTVRRAHSYKVDFYVVTVDGDPGHDVVTSALADPRQYTDAVALTANIDEKHQIRAITTSRGRRGVTSAVFGRCRYGERLVQGAEDGREADVALLPGHALVEKNHFLFYPDRNLLVYQRNAGGSHWAKFQQFLSRITNARVALEPILVSDAYERLLNDDVIPRRIDISFRAPRDPSLYNDRWTREALDLLGSAGATNGRFTISAGRGNAGLLAKMKGIVVGAARTGLARVAKVKIEDVEEPIDLIADRIIESITVQVDDRGHATAEDIYAELSAAVGRRAEDLRSFFGQ